MCFEIQVIFMMREFSYFNQEHRRGWLIITFGVRKKVEILKGFLESLLAPAEMLLCCCWFCFAEWPRIDSVKASEK